MDEGDDERMLKAWISGKIHDDNPLTLDENKL